MDRVFVLCSQARILTLTVQFPILVSKWVPTNYWGNHHNLGGGVSSAFHPVPQSNIHVCMLSDFVNGDWCLLSIPLFCPQGPLDTQFCCVVPCEYWRHDLCACFALGKHVLILISEGFGHSYLFVLTRFPPVSWVQSTSIGSVSHQRLIIKPVLFQLVSLRGQKSSSHAQNNESLLEI